MPGQDRSTLWLTLGAAAAVAAGAWAAIGYSASGDLQDRIRNQRARLDTADALRIETLKRRRPGVSPPAPVPAAQAAADTVRFLSETAQASGIAMGSKLKGITPLPATPRDAVVEKGFSIEMAGIDRKSLIQFLVDVETLRPSLRTRDLRIHRFTAAGEIDRATAVIIYQEKLEKKDEKAPR